jgi:uncharacterized protein with GYD domain
VPHYLIHFSQKPETWAKLIDKPEDRRGPVEALASSAGGKLVGYWYAFGRTDGYALFEMPDSVTAAGLSVAVAATGAFDEIATTVLITVDEMLEALGRAQEVKRTYSPPGGS